MKNKYEIQVCWYVHSDWSSLSFGIGHCPIWINKQLTFPPILSQNLTQQHCSKRCGVIVPSFVARPELVCMTVCHHNLPAECLFLFQATVNINLVGKLLDDQECPLLDNWLSHVICNFTARKSLTRCDPSMAKLIYLFSIVFYKAITQRWREWRWRSEQVQFYVGLSEADCPDKSHLWEESNCLAFPSC